MMAKPEKLSPRKKGELSTVIVLEESEIKLKIFHKFKKASQKTMSL